MPLNGKKTLHGHHTRMGIALPASILSTVDEMVSDARLGRGFFRAQTVKR